MGFNVHYHIFILSIVILKIRNIDEKTILFISFVGRALAGWVR